MPERKTINNKITDILSEISLNNEIENFTTALKLKEDLGLDSLGLINLVMELNNAFNIEIKSIEIVPENFMTIGLLEDFICKKVSEPRIN